MIKYIILFKINNLMESANSILEEELFDTIFIVRHGQRADKVLDSGIDFYNKSDPPMTKIGKY